MPQPTAQDLFIADQAFLKNGDGTITACSFCEIMCENYDKWTSITIYNSGFPDAADNVRHAHNRAFAHRILRGLALLEAQEAQNAAN